MLLDALPVLVTLGVLFVPGGVVAAAAGLRPAVVLAAAPLLSYGLATVAATVAALVDLTWGPVFLSLEAAALGAALLAARRRLPRPRLRWPGRRDAVTAAGVLAGGALSGAVLLTGFGGLDRPNQDWDYTFHANATRFISDTGQVAASALRVLNDWEAPSFFYPNAHAALAAVVRDLTAAPVFPVLNSQTLLIGGLAGLGLAVLLRDLGAPLAVTALTPVLLAGFASYPYDLLWRGPLLPFATGLALTPAFLVLVRTVTAHRGVGPVVCAALGAAALFGLQPSTALSAAVLAALMTAQQYWGRRGADAGEVGRLALAAGLAAVVAAPAVLGSVRAGTGQADVSWPAVSSPLEAVADLLLLDHATTDQPQLWLVVPLLAGLLAVRSARYLWWWLAGGALAFAMFVLTASSDAALVEALSRPWWNDRWRFAGIAALAMAPLAAHGVVRLGSAGVALVDRVRPAVGRPRRRAVAVGAVLLAVVAGSQGLYWRANSDQIASAHRSDRYLDRAEETAMAWLAARVRPGETVMNDSGDGSAYMYALEGIRPLFGHLVSSGSELGPTQLALLGRFSCLDTDPTVRDAVTELGIRYVFLGSGFVLPSTTRFPGLRDLDASPSLHLVYDRDGVRVYEVDLQPPADRPDEDCLRSMG
ncbi:DUF6541 family protein [Geodermatophilus sp. SYSU D00079]